MRSCLHLRIEYTSAAYLSRPPHRTCVPLLRISVAYLCCVSSVRLFCILRIECKFVIRSSGQYQELAQCYCAAHINKACRASSKGALELAYIRCVLRVRLFCILRIECRAVSGICVMLLRSACKVYLLRTFGHHPRICLILLRIKAHGCCASFGGPANG